MGFLWNGDLTTFSAGQQIWNPRNQLWNVQEKREQSWVPGFVGHRSAIRAIVEWVYAFVYVCGGVGVPLPLALPLPLTQLSPIHITYLYFCRQIYPSQGLKGHINFTGVGRTHNHTLDRMYTLTSCRACSIPSSILCATSSKRGLSGFTSLLG